MSIIHKLKLILMKSARNYKISMTRILAGVSLAFFASGIATAANESSSRHHMQMQLKVFYSKKQLMVKFLMRQVSLLLELT